MAHQDQGRINDTGTHAGQLLRALIWLFGGVSLNIIGLRPDCTWTAQGLMFAAILWAWSDEKTLGDRFAIARKIIMFWFSEQPQPAESYQSFVKLLRKWTDPLIELLKTVFAADEELRRRVDGGGFCSLRLRWQPRGRAANPQERSAVFVQVETVA
jgi:hypothetical protein